MESKHVVKQPALCLSGTYYCVAGRDAVVHLFEWKWTDIERECEWLAAHNYCAVQTYVHTLSTHSDD